MVCFVNMCVDTLHKGDNGDDDNNNNKVLLLLLFLITFMQGIYNYIPETITYYYYYLFIYF